MTGPRFRTALRETVPGASWKQALLRDAMHQIAVDYDLSILRDRRVDPTSPINLAVTNVTLDDLLSQLANAGHAERRIVGNTVFFASPETAGLLRTLVALREEELASDRFRRVASRQIALRRGHTVRWADLTSPGEVLDRVADVCEVQIDNPDLLPHDLWARGVFADMTPAEMLTLVLFQFDLTFEWGSDLRSVRLVPLPADGSQIVLERTHRPRQSPQDAIALWTAELGDLQTTVEGNAVVVAARLEQHEAIEQLIRGKPDPATAPLNSPVPLSRRQFTLHVSAVPASAVMKQLEVSGITFDYDAEALRDAGVDFEQPVSMNVRQADADEFLGELFDPLGLKVRYSGTRVELKLSDRPR
jgi:hypothetical protein